MSKLFIPITKIDEEKRMVFGVGADETPDRQKEIFDYEGSKPYFQEWSKTVYETSDGKSLGNVRSMHGRISAGKLEELNFDDDDKKISVGAKIVDDEEWNKVKEGLYTGFSFGGAYVKRWADSLKAGFKRYIMDPFEVSLADLPANPGATFTAIKVGGAEEVRSFKVGAREDVSESDKERAKEEYGDVDFADEKNKKYPIDTEEHIRAAWNYINKKKNQAKYDKAEVDSIKKKIVAAWKKKIDKDGPPSASQKLAQAVAEKSMSTVSSLANVLQGLAYMYQQFEQEQEREGDDTDLCEKFMEAIDMLTQVFLDMAGEEASELLEQLHGEQSPKLSGAKTMTKLEAFKALLMGNAKKDAEAEDGMKMGKDAMDHMKKAHKAAHEIHKAAYALRDHIGKMLGDKAADLDEDDKEGASKGKGKKEASVQAEVSEESRSQEGLAMLAALEELGEKLAAVEKAAAQPRGAGAGAVVLKPQDQGEVVEEEEPGISPALKALRLARKNPIPFDVFKNSSTEAIKVMSELKK